jgi:YMGG-like Gly-zipper
MSRRVGAGSATTSAALTAMHSMLKHLSALAALSLCACATVPSGPSVLSLPGSKKTFDQFRADDTMCRGYAYEQLAGIAPGYAATDSGIASAAVGTAIGAAAGALIGGGEGAAVGAGVGLLVGSAAGSQAAWSSALTAQERYDFAYQQCMYGSGHKVPVSGRFAQSRPYTAPPRPNYPPPPSYPPPPPRY